MESAIKVLEKTQYVAQNARSGFTKSSGIRSRLETVVDLQCTNCSQGLVAETLSQKLCPIKFNGDTLECDSLNGFKNRIEKMFEGREFI